MNHKNNAAIGYARRGWAVIRLRPGSKLPYAGSQGVHDATTDEKVIRTWNPNSEIGIACGKVSGLLVVDIDPRNGGDVSWKKWTDRHGEIKTLTAITGRNGLHLYLRYPGPLDYIKSPLRGVDIIRDGFYVVAPPSEIGVGYRWVYPAVPLAEAPTALLDLITRKPYVPRARTVERKIQNLDLSDDLERRIKRASAYLAKMPIAVSGNDGHTTTFVAAFTLVRGFELPTEIAFDLLANEYSPRCDPPWSEKELRHKIQEAEKKSTAERGFLLRRAS